MPFDPTKFNFGVNIAFFNSYHSHDLGENEFHPSWRQSLDSTLLDAYFRHIRHRGMKVVRFWAFEGLEGLRFDAERRVIGLQDIFERNVRDVVMYLASEHELEIYWCILSTARLTWEDTPQNFTVRQIVADSSLRREFLEKGLRPFLRLLYDLRDHVFAIDLLNEWEGSGTDWDDIKNYIQDAAQVVQHEGFKRSVGFADYETIQAHYSDDLQGHLDFYDFHAYNSSGDLPDHSSLGIGDEPCIIGECGHKDLIDIRPLGLENTVDDQEQSQTVDRFMNQALTKGYAGCLIWRYSPVGDQHRMLRYPPVSPRYDYDRRGTFLQNFLSAAGPSPTRSMDDRGWRDQHERPVWDEIEDFVSNNRARLR